MEVCRGFRVPKARDSLLKAFSAMHMIPITPKLWQKVMELAWRMDREGRTIQVEDITIAACALEIEATVLTKDSDFQWVPELDILPVLPL